MSESTPDIVEQSAERRKAGNFDEAILLARRAIGLDPNDPDAWWHLGLAVEAKDGPAASILYLEKTVELARDFAYGWFKLGYCKKQVGEIQEALGCFEKAITLDDDRTDALEEVIKEYQRQSTSEARVKLIRFTELLDKKNLASSHDINLLGNAYYAQNNFNKAIDCYRRVAQSEFSAIGFYNLGLAYSAREIGQDVDAIDAWRRALDRDPNYEKAAARISEVLPRLLKLRDRVAPRAHLLIGQADWYKHYVCPFELLDLEGQDASAQLDTKAFQRAKKLLLQEIELEGGRVSWLPGLRIDRSRAIHIADKLLNDEDRRWHSVIFSCKPLLNFLSRGDIRHFLADESFSPLVALAAIEHDAEGFGRVLGEAMAAQYDHALSAAITAGDVGFIEVLLNGRRWVGANQEDLCFEGSVRSASKVLDPLRNVSAIAGSNLVTVEQLREVFEQNDFANIIPLLPQPFQPTLEEVSSLVQNIALRACNDHGDKEAAKQMLDMVRPLLIKSTSLVHSIDEGRKALDDLIAEDNKHDASLTYRGQLFTISRKSVSFRGQSLSIDDVSSLRWGVTISGSATPAHTFVIAVSGKNGPPLSLSWTTTNDVERQRELFSKISNAAIHYILPKVTLSIRSRLAAGEKVQVGVATLTETGILFPSKGWFGSKLEHVEWANIRSKIENGDVILTDIMSGKVKLAASIATVENAAALYFMAASQE